MSRAVIDQPGLRVVATGLFFALIFGLTLRTQISAERVEKYLQRSVQILEKDFLIDFATVDVRLAKWGLPLPHLIISKLRLSPKKNLCQNSQIYIDELEIPLQFVNLLTAEKSVDLIRAKTVEVRLVDLDACLAKFDSSQEKKSKNHKNTTGAGFRSSSPADTTMAEGQAFSASNIFSQKTGTRLKEIAIDELKIITFKNYDQPVVFKQFKLFLEYENARLSKIDLKSRLYSIKDSRSDIYFLISDINAQINPETLNQVGVTFQLKGRLLDGDIQAFAQVSTQNQKVTYEVSAHNVSLKAYTPLLNRRSQETPFDKWPLSTSFYMLGEAQLGGAVEPKAIFKFKNFAAIGENMRIDFPEINVELINRQTILRPFQVSLNHIPLAPLRMVLADQYDFQSVESLGVINGLFKFEDQHHWNFDGDIQKAELIFSNRGSREIELIDSVGVNLDYKASELKFSLDDIVIHKNQVKGGLEGVYKKEPPELQLKLEINGQALNEKIWKQLTQVAQNPSIKLNWIYKRTNEERQQIKINSPELEFPGFHLSDVQIDFLQLVAGDTRSLALSLKTNRAEIRVPELKPNVAQAFFNDDTELNAEVYTALKTQIGMQGSGWKNMNFDVDFNLFDAQGVKALEHLKAKGEWRPDGTLAGVASLQNSKRVLKYNLVKKNKDEIEIIPEKKAE